MPYKSINSPWPHPPTMAPPSHHGPPLPPLPHPLTPAAPISPIWCSAPPSPFPRSQRYPTQVFSRWSWARRKHSPPASICSPPCLPRWRCTRAPSQSAGGPRVRGRGSVEAWRGRGRQAAGGHAAHGSPKCSPVVCAPMTVGITGTTRIKDNHLLVFLSCFHFRFHFEFELIFSQFELGCET